MRGRIVLIVLLAIVVGLHVMAQEDQPTIAELLESSDTFSTLTTALDAAGLTSTLDDASGSFTLFAPSDAAFGRALAELDLTAEELLADTETLGNILLYHVIPGAVFAEDVVALDGQIVASVQGGGISITLRDGTVLLNEIVPVVVPDVEAANGVIHVIDGVLLPPSAPISEEITPTPEVIATASPTATIEPSPTPEPTFTPTLTPTLTPEVTEEPATTEDPFPTPTQETLGMASPTVQAMNSAVLRATEIAAQATGTAMAEEMVSEPTEEVTAAVTEEATQEATEEPAPTDDSAAEDGFVTIADIVERATDFSTLHAALEAADLKETLADPESGFTVFAPTNAAFDDLLVALDMSAEELLADTELLTGVLLYHVVEGRLSSDLLIDGTTLVTLDAERTIEVSIEDDSIILNDLVTVLAPDIAARNGFIHVVDTVLLPPE